MGGVGRLTHERLVVRLERLSDAVQTYFPKPRDTARVRELQRAIQDALTVARSGVSGVSVKNPVQLKRELEARIQEIHSKHDMPTLKTSHKANAAITPHVRQTPDNGKENIKPALPAQHTVTRKISAVKKTPITKRGGTYTATTAGIKKRPSRSTRNKSSISAKSVTPLACDGVEEADRRAAAAAALLDLAERSPETSFTSSASASSSFVSSTSALSAATPFVGASCRKRKREVDEYTNSNTSFSNDVASQEFASSPPAQKKRIFASGMHAPLPPLDAGMSVHCAFAMGVEHAVQRLVPQDSAEGEELMVWVAARLGLQDFRRNDGSSPSGYVCLDRTVRDAERVTQNAVGAVGGAKGFWDVI